MVGVTTYNVPEPLEFQPGEGSFQNNVYVCRVCGERITGTENAVNHDSCTLARPCPACGSHAARPTLGVEHGRVDDCPTCGIAFPASGQP